MNNSNWIMSEKVYQQTKNMVQLILPALGTLYFALSQIWGLPKGEEVLGTITAFSIFLGVLLGISTRAYNNSEAKYGGVIEIEEDPETNKKLYSLALHSDPGEIDKKKEVTFKVDSQPSRGKHAL